MIGRRSFVGGVFSELADHGESALPDESPQGKEGCTHCRSEAVFGWRMASRASGLAENTEEFDGSANSLEGDGADGLEPDTAQGDPTNRLFAREHLTSGRV